jgi:hypothetical protein
MTLDFGELVSLSFHYAKEALWGNWMRWILLIISTIIFPLMGGYEMEIFKGKQPAPEPEQWVHLFINGLKLFVAGLIWAIPVIIVLLVLGGVSILALVSGGITMNPAAIAAGIGGVLFAILIAAILAIIIGLIWTMGQVRLGRTERFGEAFNVGAIMATIRKIGWGDYIVALIILWIISIVYLGIVGLFGRIPYVGWLIWLILLPPWIIFYARYVTVLYESAGPEIPDVVPTTTLAPAPEDA